MDKNTCNICKIRAYIQCDQCDEPIYFCSRGHLHSHRIKIHRTMSKSNTNSQITTNRTTNNKDHHNLIQTKNNASNDNQPQIDLRKLFEYIQTVKKEIEIKISNQNYLDAILLINKCLPISKKFYQEDHIFNIELLFKLSENYINISNLEEAINTLESLLILTQNTKTSSINIIRFKSHMLIGATCINIGDYVKALKAYNISEQEVLNCFTEPELNLKLASIFLNIGICYIYMGNLNMSEKYLKQGLTQTDGMLGNEIIYKLHADINENMGVCYESNNKPKEALNHYKKSLKTKFTLYGENDEEVLDMQYKISSVYITNKQFREAEEIMTAMTDVILKEKMKNPQIVNFYRYGVYFYTTGTVLLKNNKNGLAREYLIRAQNFWKGILNSSDPVFSSLLSLLKICDKKN